MSSDYAILSMCVLHKVSVCAWGSMHLPQCTCRGMDITLDVHSCLPHCIQYPGFIWVLGIKTQVLNQVRSHMTLSPALGRQYQAYLCEFKAILVGKRNFWTSRSVTQRTTKKNQTKTNIQTNNNKDNYNNNNNNNHNKKP